MSNDIRAQKLAAKAARDAALSAQSTANTALNVGQAAQSIADAAASALQAISGTVVTISAEMVRKFNSEDIPQSAFVLDAVSGYFYATVSHMLGDAAPDIEVYDADKDKQQIQSIIVDNNTIKLELDPDDMASNSFPLTCIVLGKNTPVSTGVSNWTQMPGSTERYRVVDFKLQISEDGITQLGDDLKTGVEMAFLAPTLNRVYVKTSTQVTSYFDNMTGVEIPVTLAEFETAANAADLIPLFSPNAG